MGGIALVTIFVGLLVTDMIMSSMEIGGISNWLAATLLVWLGSLWSPRSCCRSTSSSNWPTRPIDNRGGVARFDRPPQTGTL